MYSTWFQPEDQSAPGEQVDLSGLLGHQHCLALRQDHDTGGKFDGRRETGEIAEQHHRLVERIELRIRPGESRSAISVVDAEHVIVGGQPDVTETFGGLGEVTDNDRIIADLGRGKHCSEAHELSA